MHVGKHGRRNYKHKRRAFRAKRKAKRTKADLNLYFPAKIFTKLFTRYTAITPALSAPTVFFSVRGNAPGHPVINIDVASPSGWEIYEKLYYKYLALSCKVSGYIFNSNTFPVWFYVYPSTFSNLEDTRLEYEKRAKRYFLQSNTGTSRSVAFYSRFQSSKAMFGKKVTQEDDFSGRLVEANPIDPNTQWYWHFFLFSPDGQDIQPESVILDIKVTYYLKFYDRRTAQPGAVYVQMLEE